MRAVVLAGGLGTRLQSVLMGQPKPMAKVSGRPFLEIILENLIKNGISEVIISVGYKSEQIISYFGAMFRGIPLTYQVESEPLGTGGAMKQALSSMAEEHCLVVNGDSYVDFDLFRLTKMYELENNPIIVTAFLDEVGRFGTVELEKNRIVSFNEKSISGEGTINAGVYLLPTNLFDNKNTPNTFSFEKDFLSQDIHRREYRTFPSSGVFIDIGTPEDYGRSQPIFISRALNE